MIKIGQSRRASDEIKTSTQAIRIYVFAGVFLCTVTLVAVVLLAIYAPNNPTVITAVFAATSSLTFILIFGGMSAMGSSVDGRMTQLVDTKAEAERAKGVIEGLQQNPLIDIAKPKEDGEQP